MLPPEKLNFWLKRLGYDPVTPQDCALLIGAVAGGVATCLAAVGALWVQIRQDHAGIKAQLAEVADKVNGASK